VADAGPFAGKPAPTGISQVGNLRGTCGSGFTREGVAKLSQNGAIRYLATAAFIVKLRALFGLPQVLRQ